MTRFVTNRGDLEVSELVDRGVAQEQALDALGAEVDGATALSPWPSRR